LQIFTDSELLETYLAGQRELALCKLCEELKCDRETVVFIVENRDVDDNALTIPRL